MPLPLCGGSALRYQETAPSLWHLDDKIRCGRCQLHPEKLD